MRVECHFKILNKIHMNGCRLFAEKTYTETGTAEQRKEIFRTNLKRIEMHNYLHSVGLKSYTLGVNEYADMVSVLHGLSIYLHIRYLRMRPVYTYVSDSMYMNF